MCCIIKHDVIEANGGVEV